jgi:hypothetical protein
MSNFMGTTMGPQSIPPGMALVPVEMLAQMQQPQATQQPYHSEVAKAWDNNGQGQPVSPMAEVQNMPPMETGQEQLKERKSIESQKDRHDWSQAVTLETGHDQAGGPRLVKLAALCLCWTQDSNGAEISDE